MTAHQPSPVAGAGSPAVPRRTVLAGSAAALLACAGCGGASNGAGSAATAAGATASGPQVIAKVADIPASSGLVVDTADGPVLLARLQDKVVAHKAICTHQGAVIDGSGTCPLHGSKFDITTGAVLKSPATQPLEAVTVTESGGTVTAG